MNDFIGLQKDTALVSLLGVLESVRQAQSYSAVTPAEIFSALKNPRTQQFLQRIIEARRL